MLRNTHNWAGWGELIIFLQVASFFLFLYIDSIWLIHGEIAYFYEEFTSSWTAWLGVILTGCLVIIEKAVFDAW